MDRDLVFFPRFFTYVSMTPGGSRLHPRMSIDVGGAYPFMLPRL